MVRVRVSELVYQIGFTTFFRSQGLEHILAAAASSKQQQQAAVDTPNDAPQSHKVSGQNSPRGRVGGQKSLENPENPKKLSPGRGGEGGYWGGRPLWDNSTYLCQHRRDITQTFKVDSPGVALQRHKVSGQKSTRGRVSGQNRLKNPENQEK